MLVLSWVQLNEAVKELNVVPGAGASICAAVAGVGDLCLEGGRRQFLLLQRKPFARHRFKRICVGELLRLPLTARIDAGGKLPTRCIAAFARLFQRCVGMRTQGEPVLSAVVAVLEAPQLAPG